MGATHSSALVGPHLTWWRRRWAALAGELCSIEGEAYGVKNALTTVVASKAVDGVGG